MTTIDEERLTLEFVPYDHWTWELLVSARVKGFSGESAAYFSANELTAFAERLATYPLEEPITIASGFGVVGEAIEDEHVGIAIRQVTDRGQIGVVVHLAEAYPDRPDARREVRLELLTTYERLRRFRADVERGLQGLETEATLAGERMT